VVGLFLQQQQLRLLTRSRCVSGGVTLNVVQEAVTQNTWIYAEYDAMGI
jgi:hypothetical protein